MLYFRVGLRTCAFIRASPSMATRRSFYWGRLIFQSRRLPPSVIRGTSSAEFLLLLLFDRVGDIFLLGGVGLARTSHITLFWSSCRVHTTNIAIVDITQEGARGGKSCSNRDRGESHPQQLLEAHSFRPDPAAYAARFEGGLGEVVHVSTRCRYRGLPQRGYFWLSVCWISIDSMWSFAERESSRRLQNCEQREVL